MHSRWMEPYLAAMLERGVTPARTGADRAAVQEVVLQ